MPALSRRQRRIALLAVFVVTLVVALIVTTSAHNGGKDASRTGAPTSGSEGRPYEGSIDLKVGAISVASSGDATTLDNKVAEKVLTAVNDYVDAAVVKPILSGRPARNIEKLFGLRVLNRIQTGGADRAAISDENLPDITADLEATADPVGLDALIGPDGAVLMVGAKLSLHVRTETADGPITIARVGDLIFEPAADGRWQITGYDIEVTRNSPGGSATTSASTEPTEAP